MKTKKAYVWNEQAVVISAMRRSFRRYPPYKQCLDNAKSVYYIKSKKGKDLRRVHWTCAICKKKVNNSAKVVDHVIPVVDPNVGFVDYVIYAKRLYCPLSNLQVLCNQGPMSCHKLKSKAENKIRRSKYGKK